MLGLDGLVRTLYAYWLCGYRALDRKDAGENLIVIAQPFELMIGKKNLFPVSCPPFTPCRSGFERKTSCCGSFTGSARSITALSTVKTAVFAPMPSARVITAIAVKPGRFNRLLTA